MNFVGVDLHKKTISVCVVNQERRVVDRKRLLCADVRGIVAFFEGLGAFEAVIEATASYEWLWQLLEPHAARLVLAHPQKLRVIAESTRKSDRVDAQVLAEFLALDMIPQAYRPSPRQREHRILVRQRCFVRRRQSAARIKIRRIVSNYNADRPNLFTAEGLVYLEQVPVSAADRFVLNQLLVQWHAYSQQLKAVDEWLRAFAAAAPLAEREARAVLASLPAVGPVTREIVLSELGDVGRFRSLKQAAAYVGLAPGRRESAGKAHDLGITKAGSPLLRWALVETAWRLVRLSRRWANIFEGLRQRRGKKKAITAIARRYLTVMVSLLRRGEAYRLLAEPSLDVSAVPQAKRAKRTLHKPVLATAD
jgi:transposase